MKKTLSLFFCLFVFSQLFGVFYDIDAVFEPEALSISGTVTVDTDGIETRFLLLPNLSSEDNPFIHSLFEQGKNKMEILGVYNPAGEPLNYKLETYPATLVGAEELRRNSLLKVFTKEKRIIISFKTVFTESFQPEEAMLDGFFLWRFGWYPLLVEDVTGFALLPHSWDLKLSLPKGWTAVTGGEYIEEGRWKSNGDYFSCPIAFVNSEDYTSMTVDGNGFTVEVYYRKGQLGTASTIALNAIRVLQHHIPLLGDLKYSTIRILQDPYPGLYGITADGLVVLGDGFFTTANLWADGLLDPVAFYVVAHELTHLWFGIGAGVDFLKSNFLSEGMTDYVAHRTMFDLCERDDYLNWDAPDFMLILLSELGVPDTFSEADQLSFLDMKRAGVKAKIAAAVDEIPLNYQSYVYYQKAKRAFFMLEDYLGKEKLLEILKDYYEKFSGKTVYSEQFLSYFSNYVDREILEDLFLNPENFDPKVYPVSDGIRVDLQDRKVPVEILVETNNGSESFITTESTTIKVGNLKAVHVDPHMHTFDIERHNNHWPPILKMPGEKEPSNLDAYEFKTDSSIMFQSDGLEVSSNFIFTMFPYVKVGLTADSIYLYDGSIDNRYGAFLQFSPNNYVALALSYDELNGFGGELRLALPEKLNIGASAPLLSPRHNLVVQGGYVDSDSHYIDVLYDFNNVIKNGFEVSSEYFAAVLSGDFIDILGIYGGYVPEVDWTFTPILSVIYLKELNENDFIDPFYDLVTMEATSNEEDPLFSLVGGTDEFLELSLGVSVDLFSTRRMNFLNLFSIGGVGISLEADYRRFEEYRTIGLHASFVPLLYIVADTPVRIPITFSILYEPSEDISTLAFKIGISPGNSIFYGQVIGWLASPLMIQYDKMMKY
ncbi:MULTISPECIES: M1 family aminopeptidase [Kosmotoga]|uniref:Peptidase M1 membrane alanine aminopeptidase domain-containing protein n=1 Tax=Kosmotoga olearia (strain ATCC BAA-1733 / DSM 21960 / TBF 19.5.1) TaxID=521045 RepID=C5CDP2_KOSOT|nr:MULTISPECIES: M1 family aminopeptidase [Kosmotoga]ACR80054.1 hypothetical protein Kole_1360 [Kosmotoga olearia TBF 19.5.1]MDI3524295.1 hypothetical protein [Kosmotoga sp.]MDK2954141.1 hypothetical protein [Kosmotoga sp.]OAA20492.1 hypothetical protein DU53_07505 [Kosmotoga sp. DU53]